MCDCVVKDSINFLDHINGKKRKLYWSNHVILCTDHAALYNSYSRSVLLFTDQRNMGMSMKVEKSTVDQVRKRFEFNKKKKEEEKKKYGEFRNASLSFVSACFYRF